MFRVLVCGGRDYADRAAVDRTLNDLRRQYGPLMIIQGGATGADKLARDWALRQNVGRLINEPADWNNIDVPGAVVKINRYGKPYNAVAGHIRNQRMLDGYKPDLVIAFPGGKGTADMVRRAKAAGVRVLELVGMGIEGLHDG